MLVIFSDDEDDTAELLAELQRIKRDRAEEIMKRVKFVVTSIDIKFI